MIRLDEDMRNTYGKVATDTDLRVAICGHNPGSEQGWGTGSGSGSSAVPKGQAEDESIVNDAKKSQRCEETVRSTTMSAQIQSVSQGSPGSGSDRMWFENLRGCLCGLGRGLRELIRDSA